MGVANNGQYVRKFQGKRHQFGAVSMGWKRALEKYNHDWPHVLAGRTPPPMVSAGVDAESIAYIFGAFIARERERVKANKLAPGSLVDIINAIELAGTHLGGTRRPLALCQDDWAHLRTAMSHVWKYDDAQKRWKKTDGRVGPDVLKRRIVHVRAAFRWAHGANILAELPRYGDGLKYVSLGAIRKSRSARAREHGAKLFQPADIMRIFNKLDQQLQAMFLLSINCGFTAIDCANLPWWAVDLDAAVMRFPRKKTGEHREVTLWPETVEALRHVQAMKLACKPELAKVVVHQERGEEGEPIGRPVLMGELVFVTEYGNQWAWRRVEPNKEGREVENHYDAIAKQFDPVLVALGLKRKGIGFGTGRHTFQTHALRCGDKNLVMYIMGHAGADMSQWYDHPDAADLRQVTDGVRRRLLEPQLLNGQGAAAVAPALRLVG